MKITWLSNAPWAPTGYGQQTKLFVPRLKKLGHELVLIAFYGLEGASLTWDGIPVYPRAFHGYGQDIVGADTAMVQADISISLIDAWVMEPSMYPAGFRWVPWFPVDMETIPPPVIAKAAQAYQPLVYSRHAERLARAAGLDVRYVPHGVDLATFTPQVQREAREKLRLPDDRYFVGMVAANKGQPSRKALPQSIAAFAAFHRRHPDTALYLHCHKGLAGEMGGVNLVQLCEHHGLALGRDVWFVDQHALVTGMPDAALAATYNALDVLLACSMGEGFGVPIVEAQACGTPVITGDWTAMSELTWKGRAVAREDAELFWTGLGANQYLPHIGALEAALEETYQFTYARKPPDQVKAYDAGVVTETYWKPVLAEIAERVAAEKQGAPVAVPVAQAVPA